MNKDQKLAVERLQKAQSLLAVAQKIGNSFAVSVHEAEITAARAAYEKASAK